MTKLVSRSLVLLGLVAGRLFSAGAARAQEDATPPAISSIEASPYQLWPPKHVMVPVTVSVQVSDDSDEAPECEIVSVESDEAVNGPGDGNTDPDWRITGDLKVELRAERDGGGDGRVYTLNVKCADDSGNESASSVQVTVPHDQGLADEARIRCKLKVSFDRIEKNRLSARLDLSGAADAIPANATPPRLDDLEGYRLVLSIGAEELQGVFSRRGVVVTEHLRARWLPRKGLLQVDVRGIDLPEVLGLDPAVEGKRIPVDVPITAEAFSPAGGGESVFLCGATLPSSYRHTLPKGHRRGSLIAP